MLQMRIAECFKNFTRPVAPHGEHAVGTQDTSYFCVKAIQIEPMQRLRNRHQVEFCTGQPAGFGNRDAVGDAVMGYCVSQLFRAQIRRDHFVEMLNQPY